MIIRVLVFTHMILLSSLSLANVSAVVEGYVAMANNPAETFGVYGNHNLSPWEAVTIYRGIRKDIESLVDKDVGDKNRLYFVLGSVTLYEGQAFAGHLEILKSYGYTAYGDDYVFTNYRQNNLASGYDAFDKAVAYDLAASPDKKLALWQVRRMSMRMNSRPSVIEYAMRRSLELTAAEDLMGDGEHSYSREEFEVDQYSSVINAYAGVGRFDKARELTAELSKRSEYAANRAKDIYGQLVVGEETDQTTKAVNAKNLAEIKARIRDYEEVILAISESEDGEIPPAFKIRLERTAAAKSYATSGAVTAQVTESSPSSETKSWEIRHLLAGVLLFVAVGAAIFAHQRHRRRSS